MCRSYIWMQEIKSQFNTMKILIVVFEFVMYLLALKIKFKNKIKSISYLPKLFFSHNISGNTTFFLGLLNYYLLVYLIGCYFVKNYFAILSYTTEISTLTQQLRAFGLSAGVSGLIRKRNIPQTHWKSSFTKNSALKHCSSICSVSR
jgi:hypothetical protein